MDGGSLAPRDGRVSSKNETSPVCFLFHTTRSSRTNQLLPAYQVYCCTYCCTAVLLYQVCSKGLVGGWVEGALHRPWWVGGPFRTWESFFALWEMNPSFCFDNTGLQLVLGSTTVLTAALLCLYYRTYYCTAVLLPCYYLVFYC